MVKLFPKSFGRRHLSEKRRHPKNFCHFIKGYFQTDEKLQSERRRLFKKKTAPRNFSYFYQPAGFRWSFIWPLARGPIFPLLPGASDARTGIPASRRSSGP
ncbi:hypothetical protein NJLHNGOC_04075 [Novacetimonas cocois]|uniref:Uncharacterized protein n=1 Tax=Novacetimonas cocois TaxID=1747507 RepID=A0A365YYV6_9PROT|nr:hypothetical protein NJLHNGOC_04075 [Novacetimonas cocois]